LKLLKNKCFILVFFLAAGLLSGCGGGGSGGGGTTAVSCTSYTPMSANGKYKISVKEAGIYLISPPTVKTFCLDASNVNFTSFKLQNFDPGTKTFFDVPISYDLAGNIEFYGVGVSRNDYTAPNADYTETNIYWLVPVPATSTVFQMTPKPSVTGTSTLSPMTTSHLEQNNIWWDSMTGGLGYDHWFWEGVKTTSVYNFSVQNYDNPLNDSSKIFVYLHAQGLSSHSLTIDTNTATFSPYPVSWNSSSRYLFSTNLLGLTNGLASSLQITNNCAPSTYSSGPCFPTGEVVYFNWLELEYPAKALNDQLIFHGNFATTGSGSYSFTVNGFSQNTIELFDISDPKTPWKFDSSITVVPNGGGYQINFGDNLTLGVPSGNYIVLTPAQRKTPAGIVPVTTQDLTSAVLYPGPYDYVMITHETLNTGIQPLATYRRGQGFKVIRVNIGDVYDSYSGGMFTPQAIQDFLKDVHSRWSATYALLVGDASVDYKNYLGYGQENLVPTYLEDYSYGTNLGGQIPSDFWFVPTAGSQNVPRMAIGRLPAKNITELNTMVSKIINYETVNKPVSPQTWNYILSFVAGSGFDSDSENLVSMINSATSSFSYSFNEKRYYSDYFETPPFPYSSSYYYSSNLESNIINDINNGSLITNYFGHGSIGFWGDCNPSIGCPNLFFNSSDVANLNNSTMLTFLVTLDCLNAYFAGYGEGSPNIPFSISETAVKSSGGAVASFSPTGQGYDINHNALAQVLYPVILTTKPAPPCGPPGSGCTNPPPQNTIGAEIQTAETTYLINTNDTVTVSMFVLLGDPATQLWVP